MVSVLTSTVSVSSSVCSDGDEAWLPTAITKSSRSRDNNRKLKLSDEDEREDNVDTRDESASLDEADGEEYCSLRENCPATCGFDMVPFLVWSSKDIFEKCFF